MKIKIRKDALLEVLDIADKFHDDNNALPVCANFLVSGDGNSITIDATDLKSWFRGTIKDMSTEIFSFCVPAMIFYRTIKDFRDNNIDISVSDKNITIGKGKSKYKLSTIPVGEFPNPMKMPETKNEIVINSLSYRDMTTNCSKFTAVNDMAKLNMSGVYIGSSVDSKSFVASGTDGHRMCYCVSDIESLQKFDGVLLDDETIKKSGHLCNPDKAMEIIHNENHIAFIVDGQENSFLFISSLLQQKFPLIAVSKVLSAPIAHEVVMNSVEMFETVRRIANYTDKETGNSTIKLNDAPSVFAEDMFFGNTGEESLAMVDIPKDHKFIDISFNCNKLKEILGQIQEENFIFGYSEANKPVYIFPIYPTHKNIEYKYMIMPSVSLSAK